MIGGGYINTDGELVVEEKYFDAGVFLPGRSSLREERCRMELSGPVRIRQLRWIIMDFLAKIRGKYLSCL